MSGGLHGIDGGIGDPGLVEAARTEPAAVALAAMFAVRRRIVARPAQPEIEPEPRAFADDIRLGHMLERRLDAERFALDAGFGGEFGKAFERGDELGTAIRITRIIERVDTD